MWSPHYYQTIKYSSDFSIIWKLKSSPTLFHICTQDFFPSWWMVLKMLNEENIFFLPHFKKINFFFFIISKKFFDLLINGNWYKMIEHNIVVLLLSSSPKQPCFQNWHWNMHLLQFFPHLSVYCIYMYHIKLVAVLYLKLSATSND